MSTRWKRFLLAGAVAVPSLLVGCSDDGKKVAPPDPSPPVIESIEPDSAEVGATVRIEGEHLGGSRGASEVLFGSIDASTSSWSETRIDAAVPGGAVSGGVRVVVDGLSSNQVSFTVVTPPPPHLAIIDRLIPTRTIFGDTVTVVGSGFGPTEGTSLVTFAGTAGSRIAGAIDSWSETRIRVLVPDGTTDGEVRIAVEETESNGVGFSVAPRIVTFGGDLRALFTAHGCTSCHGGSGGLYLDTPADLLEGGTHGPAAIPRESAGSNIIRKIGPNPPFGSRMPLGCESVPNCLTNAEILLIADWIDQGARAN